MITAQYYSATAPDTWTGRVDGTEADLLRWHQVIQLVDLSAAPLPLLSTGQQGIVFLGFACDEGVRRNKGRVGAAAGPMALRKACANFPVHFEDNLILLDAGDICCPGGNLEVAQQILSEAVTSILNAGYLPLLLGGGHEITYGHARSISAFATHHQQVAGFINFDAHFDIRIPGPEGVSSGTGFWQLWQDSQQLKQRFHYLALGIQQHGNTRQLFKLVEEAGADYVSADLFHEQDLHALHIAVDLFLQQVDQVYLTTCLDVFAAPFAPGVSATAFNGIVPGGIFLEIYRAILQSGKVRGVDIAELNPSLDIDNRTAKLGASIVFEIVQGYGAAI
jgi:formiminoglutamase